MTFITPNGTSRELFDAPFNVTIENERAVEIPLARDFINRQTGRGLEIGNVLSHYLSPWWTTVDKYEQNHGVLNLDVMDLRGYFNWVVSISTLEHVGYDEHPRDTTKAIAAIEHLRSMVLDGGEMMISIPTGHHPLLDRLIEHLDWTDTAFYRRTPATDGAGPIWDQVPFEAVEYDHEGHSANGVWFGWWTR